MPLHLELPRNEFYAGERIRALIRLESEKPLHIRILSAQLAGFLSVNSEIIDEQRLGDLKNIPNYVAPNKLVRGAGSLTANELESIPVYSVPPSIIATDVRVDPHTRQDYEWYIPVDMTALPSYSGKSARLFYKLLITLHLASNDVRQFEHYIRILPTYNPDLSDDQYPQRLFDIKQTYSSLEDLSWSRNIVNEPMKPSPADRLKNNEVLSLDMVTEYFRDPNRLPDTCQRENNSAEAFSLLLENFNHSVFEIKRDTLHIATLSIGKQFHRAGETVTGSFDFTAADLTTFQYNVVLEEYELAAAIFTKGDREIETECIEISSSEAIVWLYDKHSFRLGVSLRCFSSLSSNLFVHKLRLRLTLWVADPKAAIGQGVPEWIGSTPDSPFVEKFELSIPIALVPLPIFQATIESFNL